MQDFYSMSRRRGRMQTLHCEYALCLCFPDVYVCCISKTMKYYTEWQKSARQASHRNEVHSSITKRDAYQFQFRQERLILCISPSIKTKAAARVPDPLRIS